MREQLTAGPNFAAKCYRRNRCSPELEPCEAGSGRILGDRPHRGFGAGAFPHPHPPPRGPGSMLSNASHAWAELPSASGHALRPPTTLLRCTWVRREGAPQTTRTPAPGGLGERRKGHQLATQLRSAMQTQGEAAATHGCVCRMHWQRGLSWRHSGTPLGHTLERHTAHEVPVLSILGFCINWTIRNKAWAGVQRRQARHQRLWRQGSKAAHLATRLGTATRRPTPRVAKQCARVRRSVGG